MKRLILRYKDLQDFWDVKSYNLLKNLKCNVKSKPLSFFIEVIKDIVPEEEYKNWNVELLDKIRFSDWKIFSSVSDNIKMTQFRWKAGDIFVSKINARQKAIWLLEEWRKDVWVTSHFRILRPKKWVNWEYLQMALRTEYCSHQFEILTWWQWKWEISEENLLKVEVPYYEENKQIEIINSYKNNKIKAQNLKYEALEKEKNIDDFLMSELGIEKQEQKRKKWPFVVRYKDLENDWWVQKNTQKVQIWKSHIDFIEMWKVCYDFKNWVNFSKEQVWKWTKFVNIKDIYNNWYVDTNKLELVEVSEKEIKNNKVNDNDIIFVRSSVKYEWVAYPSLIDTKWEDIVFCWFLIKASIDTNIINPKYLLYLLRWEIYREKIISTAVKTIITNISQDKLKNLKIPLPTIWDEKTPWTQKYIVSKIDEMKKEIDKLNIEAERLEKEADENLEKTILWV